jgi:hypothetical protein
MSDGLRSEYQFWRIVRDLKLSPESVDRWTLHDIRRANAFLDMSQDYKSAWHAFYEVKAELNAGEDNVTG